MRGRAISKKQWRVSVQAPFRRPYALQPAPSTAARPRQPRFKCCWSLSQVIIKGSGLHAGREFAAIQLSLRISRRKGYLGWNVLLPMVLVTALGATAFAPPTCDVNARLANALIMALTLIAFKLSLSTVVPQVRNIHPCGGISMAP